ncbi:hypothetical protein V2A60_004727 [Cordyceps javanica]
MNHTDPSASNTSNSVVLKRYQLDAQWTSDPARRRVGENQLLGGLAIVLEYLNDGSGEEKLARLRRRADLWCTSYHGRPDYVLRDAEGRPLTRVPQCVVDVHPHLFDVSRVCYSRLETPLPALVVDDEDDGSGGSSSSSSSELESESGAVAAPITGGRCGLFTSRLFGGRRGSKPTCQVRGRSRRRQQQEEDEEEQENSQPEQFPPYTEPVLVPNAEMRRLLDRYEREREPFDQKRRERAHARELAERGTTAAEAGPFATRVRVCVRDLRDSPILWYIPELLACLAHLPPPPTYVQWLRGRALPPAAAGPVDPAADVRRRRARQSKGPLPEGQESERQAYAYPCSPQPQPQPQPQPSLLGSPIAMRRLPFAKRGRERDSVAGAADAAEGDEDAAKRRRYRPKGGVLNGRNILAMIGH